MRNGTSPRSRTIQTTAYLAHQSLETRAALAHWADGRLTVWTGTQRPFGVRAELAAAFGIGEERVRVIVPPTGSAFGGKQERCGPFEFHVVLITVRAFCRHRRGASTRIGAVVE